MEEPGDGGVPCMLSSGHGVPITSPTHSTVLTKSAKIWHRWGRCSPGSPPLRSCWQLTAAGVGEAHACLKVWPMVGLSEWPSPTHMGSTNWIPWAMRLEENGNVFRGQFVYSIRSNDVERLRGWYQQTILVQHAWNFPKNIRNGDIQLNFHCMEVRGREVRSLRSAAWHNLRWSETLVSEKANE